MSFSYICLYNINQMPIIIMKQILYLTIIIAALGLWSCQDEPEIPLEIFPDDIDALKIIYNQLGVANGDYPMQWSLDDQSTWKNAGIEFDTITDGENQEKFLAVSSITVYLMHEGEELPWGLLNLRGLRDLKVYGCTGSRFDGRFIPSTVKSLLVDRLNPDDPGYIHGVPNEDNIVILANKRAAFSRLVMHGVDMKNIDFKFQHIAIIDLSHNTLEGEVPYNLWQLWTPANMSYNKYTGLQFGWDSWAPYNMTIPLVQHNLIESIPESVLQSVFWERYHENFMGNPGYVAPQP